MGVESHSDVLDGVEGATLTPHLAEGEGDSQPATSLRAGRFHRQICGNHCKSSFEASQWLSPLIRFQGPIFAGTSSEFDETKLKEFYDMLFTIDEHYFPNGNEWIAGENITVADFAYAATMSTLLVSVASLAKAISML